MTAQAVRIAATERTAPVSIINGRLMAMTVAESKIQTAFAIIGALEQDGWVIVRKRHQR